MVAKRSLQNLKPFTSNQDREKARENGRKGGLAAGIARRERAKQNYIAFENEARREFFPEFAKWQDSIYHRLKDKHKRFLQEYLSVLPLNGAAAARAVGYSEKSAKYTAYKILCREDVRQAWRDYTDYVAYSSKFNGSISDEHL